MDLSNFPYLPFYVVMFSLWLVKMNKAIMFWLYLWQLKEYHWGRFKDHFTTAKGRSIFINKLFGAKTAILAGSILYVILAQRAAKLGFDAMSLFIFANEHSEQMMAFSAMVFVLFVLEAGHTVISFFKGTLKHPLLTKKSVFLIAVSHFAIFAWVLPMFYLFLGEMSLFDFSLAAFLLLLADFIVPFAVLLVVLVLQPLTIMQKARILKRASKVIDKRSDLVTIGITGSYGKSTTKELLAGILATRYKILKTQANQNTEIGIAQTVTGNLKPEHKIFVCEIGAVHKGRIRQVANVVKPKIGILAGINQQHMAVFGSQENIIQAKYEILEALPQEGTAILNWDSDLIRKSFDSRKDRIKARKIIFCSVKEKKDIWAENIQAKTWGLSFNICSNDGDIANIIIKLPGAQSIESILLAVAAAKTMGMALGDIARVLGRLDLSQMGMKIKRNSSEVTVLNSTYSTNPDAVIAHLDYLKLYSGKKAVIMPSIIELGKSSKEQHYLIGKKIGQTCDLAVIVTKERFKDIKRGAVESGMKPENIIFLENPLQIWQKIKNTLNAGDVLLLEGRLPFDTDIFN